MHLAQLHEKASSFMEGMDLASLQVRKLINIHFPFAIKDNICNQQVMVSQKKSKVEDVSTLPTLLESFLLVVQASNNPTLHTHSTHKLEESQISPFSLVKREVECH